MQIDSLQWQSEYRASLKEAPKAPTRRARDTRPQPLARLMNLWTATRNHVCLPHRVSARYRQPLLCAPAVREGQVARRRGRHALNARDTHQARQHCVLRRVLTSSTTMQPLLRRVRATGPEQSRAKSGHVLNATCQGHVLSAAPARRASPPPCAPLTQPRVPRQTFGRL